MSEAIHIQNRTSAIQSKNLLGLKFLSVEKLESQRFGLMVVLILLVGCLGGVAVGMGALTQIVPLIILAFSTMMALSMMLAVAPIKYVVYSSAFAIAADVIIISVNLIA